MPLAVGQVIHARYRIARLIGQGGFGAVYRAWDLSLKQPCAVKENLDASPEAQRQFEREATILAGLRHSNLPRVTDYFFLPGQGQYLVMDFIDGYNLVEVVRQSDAPLTESRALDWIGQVCSALTYLHSQNPPVIHRDIKPQNIIITPAGQALLVDFGISKIYDPVLSTTGGARGVTPAFSPPEQYGRARTDPRSDLYSLAATLYFLLTTHEPPDAMDRIVHGAPLTPPRQHNADITPAVEQAILRSLEIESGQRYPSIKEFRQALEGQLSAPSSVQLRQPVPASAPATPAPTPVTPQILASPPVQAASINIPAPAQATSTPSAPHRLVGVTLTALFCIVFGSALLLFIFGPVLGGIYIPLLSEYGNTVFSPLRELSGGIIGLMGLVGGLLMLVGDNRGRRMVLIFLALLVTIVLAIIVKFNDFRLYLTLSFIFALYQFFYLHNTNVRDYFLPLEAPHTSNTANVLEILGRLHLLLGFWLLLPILIGAGMLVRRSRDMWWSAYLTTTLFCLLLFAGTVSHLHWFGYSSLIRSISLLVFTLESQVWLYLRRPEVRQLYP